MTSVELNALVREVADLYRAQEGRRRVRLTVKEDPAVATIVADQGRLRQLLHNLLTNAIEALEGQASGEVLLATRLAKRGADEVAEITIEDNGPGFQRELIAQVFDPYVTTKAKGTGLGLAIVRKIIEEHGGHIEAENRVEGGARIRIDLPVAETPRQARTDLSERRTEPRRERA
jgi:nitrogen fixation/metabolism regulation signal transduction histidine kinase